MAIIATPNQAATLSILAADGSTALFARAKVYNSVGTLVATISLPHVAEGMYAGAWTPTIEGFYQAVYTLYTDSGFTTLATYDKAAETVDVNALKNNVLRLLGVHNDNAVIDNQSYNGNGDATGCRIRCYDTKANALAAGLTGLLFQYTMTATYAGTNLTNFTMVREL
jgi:hypothetical protein